MEGLIEGEMLSLGLTEGLIDGETLGEIEERDYRGADTRTDAGAYAG